MHRAKGFVAINDINPQAPVHVLVLPEHHVDTFRDVGEFGAGETKRMLEFVAETAAKVGLTDYRVLVNVGAAPARPCFICTGTSWAAGPEPGQRCRQQSRSRRQSELDRHVGAGGPGRDARARRRRAATRCA